MQHYRHQIWMLLGRSQFFYPLYRLIGTIKQGISQTNNDTDLVLEGYPRSANTFAYAAFTLMQEGKFPKIEVAHHIHGPMQLVEGIRREIPCLLLIREPVDSVVSLLIREEKISPISAFRNYIKFHEKLLAYRDQMVISDFSTTTNHFSKVVDALNEKYHTSFNVLEIDDEFMKRCRIRIKEMDKSNTGKEEVDKSKVGLPTEERRKKKRIIRKSINETVSKRLIKESNDIYQQFKINSIN